jgi:drug/metabolite transporter (DMT)-like permease
MEGVSTSGGSGQVTAVDAITPKTRWLGYGACALAGCLWGTGFYFGRLALDEMIVEWMVLFRFLFAGLGMLPVVLMHRGDRARLTGEELRVLLLCSALGVPLQFLLQFHGLARTTVSHASLMVGAMPVLLAAAAAVLPKSGSTGSAGLRCAAQQSARLW